MRYEIMSEKYLNLFLEAENWYMYFDEVSANEKRKKYGKGAKRRKYTGKMTNGWCLS